MDAHAEDEVEGVRERSDLLYRRLGVEREPDLKPWSRAFAASAAGSSAASTWKVTLSAPAASKAAK